MLLYTLGFPNGEIRYGFLNFLIPYTLGGRHLVKVEVEFSKVIRNVYEYLAKG
ncbi:MAG: hypothetical protein K2I55_12700 [Phocaeicola sp.]|nr:hypothetical protein [Phocaeicola sp.]